MVLFAAIPLWSQVEASDTGDTGAVNPDADLQMQTPPPVSGQSYPTAYAGAEKANYLRGGLTFTTTHTDNVLYSNGTSPVSDFSYSVWPTIGLDKTTSRLHLTFTYSPGFTIYQKTSSLNQSNQNVGVNFQYRLSPHVSVTLSDGFAKTSNVFNQPNSSSTPVPGSAQAPTVAVIAPVADQLTNTSNGTLTYQFSRSSMVGIGGNVTDLHYLNQSQVPGLFDSNSYGGSAFYSHRLSKKQYVGAQYQYQRILAYPTGQAQSETQTHTIYLFYTIYLKPTLSLSFSGGPQYTDTPQPPLPNSRTWGPAASTSFSWQTHHTNIAANYSRVVSGGGGLVGAFHSNTASASIRQQLTPSWNVGLSGGYSIYKSVTPFSFFATPGGHTVSGTASLAHTFGEHLNASLGYTRLHQSYGGLALINNAPDTNDEWVSISYTFARPIGR